MKLLIITDAWHPQINGVVRTYEHLQEEFDKMGHEVHVIGPADFPLRFPMPGYNEIHLALFPYAHLQKCMRSYQADHIHIATEGPLGWAARRYCHKHKHPYTTAYHTQFPDYAAKRIGKVLPFLYNKAHNWGKDVVRRFHKGADVVFVATQSLEDELKSWGFKASMQRLTRGANLDLFRPLHDGEENIFNHLNGPVALYVGRIAIEKNIEAFLSMPWDGSKILIGDGPSLSALKTKYPEARFLGIKQGEELAAHYRSADVFVFPSRTDTFGIVLVEALASGIPVAGYDVTGPKDIITEPFLGATHNDNLALAAQTALKAGTPKQRADHVKKHHTWENMAQQFESGLKNCLKSNN